MDVQHKWRMYVWAVPLAVLLFTFAANLGAQVSGGSIAGLVTDQTGAVIPGATITIENEGTGIQQVDSTNCLKHGVQPTEYEVEKKGRITCT